MLQLFASNHKPLVIFYKYAERVGMLSQAIPYGDYYALKLLAPEDFAKYCILNAKEGTVQVNFS